MRYCNTRPTCRWKRTTILQHIATHCNTLSMLEKAHTDCNKSSSSTNKGPSKFSTKKGWKEPHIYSGKIPWCL